MSEESVWGGEDPVEVNADVEGKFYEICDYLECVPMSDLKKADIKIDEGEDILTAVITLELNIGKRYFEDKSFMLAGYERALREELERVEELREKYDERIEE